MTEPSLAQALRDTVDGFFSPDKKRDAARLLRTIKGNQKKQAMKYADMLESEARLDQEKSDIFRAECARDERLARAYEENNR